MEQDFSKYSKEELVGKMVLYERGQSYYDTLSKYILKIAKVTKTSIKVEANEKLPIIEEKLFNIENGRERGLVGMQFAATISRISLITEEEANNFRKEWKRVREQKELLKIVTEKIPNASYEQLQKISEILN